MGPKIRARRMQMHLSLTELARRSGLSIAFLSQIERNQAGLTVDSLVKIAQALEVSVSYFLATQEADIPVHFAKDFHYFSLDSSRVQLARAGSMAADRALEPVLSVVPPMYESESLKHAGEEFIYVLKGELVILLGQKQYLLQAGDTAHFKSGIRHKWKNPTPQETHVLWVGTPKLF